MIWSVTVSFFLAIQLFELFDLMVTLSNTGGVLS